jgi:hypothetical protein
MRKFVSLLAVVFITAVVIPSAYAGTSTLALKRTNLINVPDAAGIWQFESGPVRLGTSKVGTFSATRRFITGATADMFTVTLFFKGNPPQNVTLMGSWTTSPGGGAGGVSAASTPYQFLQHDGTFVMTPAGPGAYKLTINWTGAGSVP